MDLGLKDKVAIVTAASKGIGKAVAVELAKEGAKVSICAREAGSLNGTRDEIAALGAEVLVVPADVTKKEDVDRVINETAQRFKRIDILVNNAGDAWAGHYIDQPDEAWKAAFDVNFYSAVYFTRGVVPYMRQQKWGRIINIASVSGHSPLGGMVDYNSAKAAMLAFSKTLAIDLAKDGILVNAVNPALVYTPLWERLADSLIPAVGQSREEVFKNLAGQLLLVGRYGRPEEVAAVVAFLASERSSFVVAASWDVDGGFTKSIM